MIWRDKMSYENNQKKHNRNKLILKILGACLTIIGLVFIIIGIVDFFKGFNSMKPPTLFWCMFVGVPLLGIGAAMLNMGFRREVGRYVKNETLPIINEASEELAPAITSMATAAKEGLSTGIICDCGAINSKNSKFCKKCGKQLHLCCPQCNAEISADSIYCEKCGAKIK